MNKQRKSKTETKDAAENYSSESTVGNQSARKGRAAAAAPLEAGPSLDERIARKAYELYEQRGRSHGHELDDWLEAEHLVRAEASAPSHPQRSRRQKRGN